jgi:stage III sporulation protein AD
MDIFSVAAIGIIGAVLAVTIKQTRPELSVMVSLITCIVLLLYTSNSLRNILNQFNQIISKSGIDANYFKIALKACAIAYITEFASALCKDAGENAIAVKTEFAGKISILLLSIPIIFSFLSSISNFLNNV